MKQQPQLFLKCELCNIVFEYNGHKRRRWCSDKCKVAAWRNLKTLQDNKSSN